MEVSRGQIRGADLGWGDPLTALLGEELAQQRRDLEKEWDRLEGERKLELRAVPAAELDARRIAGQVLARWGQRDLTC